MNEGEENEICNGCGKIILANKISTSFRCSAIVHEKCSRTTNQGLICMLCHRSDQREAIQNLVADGLQKQGKKMQKLSDNKQKSANIGDIDLVQIL